MSRDRRTASRCGIRGFTLIEIMVVLVIIGVVVTFVTLSIGADPQSKALETEARRLLSLVELASEESVLRSNELALKFTESSYEFFTLENGQWQAVEDDPQYRKRDLPKGMSMKLTLEEAPSIDLTGDKDKIQPQVFLLSSGEMTPFTLEFHGDATQRHFNVKATLTGQLTFETP